MAKWKRTKVGAVLKDKEFDTNKKSYIKFNKDCDFKQGDCLSLESKKQQLASLEAAFADGKISEEIVGEIRERISNMKDFVLFEMVKVERLDQVGVSRLQQNFYGFKKSATYFGYNHPPIVRYLNRKSEGQWLGHC